MKIEKMQIRTAAIKKIGVSQNNVFLLTVLISQ